MELLWNGLILFLFGCSGRHLGVRGCNPPEMLARTKIFCLKTKEINSAFYSNNSLAPSNNIYQSGQLCGCPLYGMVFITNHSSLTYYVNEDNNVKFLCNDIKSGRENWSTILGLVLHGMIHYCSYVKLALDA